MTDNALLELCQVVADNIRDCVSFGVLTKFHPADKQYLLEQAELLDEAVMGREVDDDELE